MPDLDGDPLSDSFKAALTASGEERLARWGDVFDRVAPRLAVVISFRLPQALRVRQSVEDVLQDVFLVALKQLDSFRDADNDGAFRWLLAITYNVLKTVKRREAVRRIERRFPDGDNSRAISLFGGDDRMLQTSRTASRRAMQNEEARLAPKILAHLSHDDQELIVMRLYEERSYDEIAERKGITNQAARKRLSRALERARKIAAAEIDRLGWDFSDAAVTGEDSAT